jgi:transposase
VSEVARRWQVCPQQVFAWRHAARRDVAAMPRETASPASAEFVPIVAEAVPSEASTVPVIEVELAGAVVRVAGGMDGSFLTAVLRAVRASASRS